MDILTSRQKMFLAAFTVCQDPIQAALQAGYSPKSAKRIGNELCRNPKLKWQVDKILREKQAKEDVAGNETLRTHEEIVHELRHLAFSNPKKIIYWEGDKLKLRKFEEVSDEEAASISEISMTRTGLKVKFRNKETALAEMRRAVGPGTVAPETAYPFDLSKLTPQDSQTFARLFQTARPIAFQDPRGAGRYWARVLGQETWSQMTAHLKGIEEARQGRAAFWSRESQMMEPWKTRDPQKYAEWQAQKEAEGF